MKRTVYKRCTPGGELFLIGLHIKNSETTSYGPATRALFLLLGERNYK